MKKEKNKFIFLIYRMNLQIRKTIFSIFVIITFLAGWYFYVINTSTPYMEYMDNMQQTLQVTPTGSGSGSDISNNVLPTPFEVQDASRDQPPYNANMYAGFDPTSQYVGVFTNLDKIHQSTEFSELSENPMDSNWGGVLYTKQAVDSGKYEDNLVVPYGYNPELGIGNSTSIHNGAMKSVFA